MFIYIYTVYISYDDIYIDMHTIYRYGSSSVVSMILSWRTCSPVHPKQFSYVAFLYKDRVAEIQLECPCISLPLHMIRLERESCRSLWSPFPKHSSACAMPIGPAAGCLS